MAWLLKQLLKSVQFSIYKSKTPVGEFLGNVDLVIVDFPYVILVTLFHDRPVFTGYFHNA